MSIFKFLLLFILCVLLILNVSANESLIKDYGDNNVLNLQDEPKREIPGGVEIIEENSIPETEDEDEKISNGDRSSIRGMSTKPTRIPSEEDDDDSPNNEEEDDTVNNSVPRRKPKHKIIIEEDDPSNDTYVPVDAEVTRNGATDDDDETNQASTVDNQSTNSTSVEYDIIQHENTYRIKVPQSYVKYRLKPKLIGRSRIPVLNAQDNTFYLNRSLKSPVLTLWILTKKTKSLTYASKRLFEEAWKMGIQIIFIDTSKLDMIVTQDGLEHILYRGERVKLPDAVYPRLGAVVDYFGMAVIRQLEKNGVLVLNPTLSIEISRDKLYALQHLAAHSLPIPKTMITKLVPLTESTINGIEREFTYPIVLKKSSGSQGKGVMLIDNRQALKDIIEMLDNSKPIIFQEYISRSKGRDIRVFIVGGKAIGAMMRVAKKGFKSNFHQGGYVKRVRLTPAIEWLAIEAASIIGLDIAGVDILIDEHTYKICEVNASPGFEGFELATGVNVPKKILEFIKLRTGVWNKNMQSKKKRKHKILIPIIAEHVKRPEKEESSSSTTNETNKTQTN